jgi:hypothetical protein
MATPDFFLVGAPKAGTTALHAALARHPGLFLSPVKEPKYFLCNGSRPPRAEHRGPGDAHSRLEWVWRRDEYERLFDAAPPGIPRGESTPFYLYDPRAAERIRDAVPHARLVAVLRDPVDRAYSNWMHLRSDGLEPEADFLTALAAEPDRVRRGFAPFWHYQGLGRYGEQLERLLTLFPREQVHVLRYRELVDSPDETLAAVHAFLGVEPAATARASAENVKPFVPAGPRNDQLRRLVRAGAWAGSFAPPQAWRRASVPLLRRLHAGGTVRPPLDRDVRREAVRLFADDVATLERVLGRSFADWLDDTGRGSFVSRAGDGDRTADGTAG